MKWTKPLYWLLKGSVLLVSVRLWRHLPFRNGGEIAVDLGTANTVVFVRGHGVVLFEPSVVAIDEISGRVLAVGAEARRMIGRTPANYLVSLPLAPKLKLLPAMPGEKNSMSSRSLSNELALTKLKDMPNLIRVKSCDDPRYLGDPVACGRTRHS